MFAWGGFGWDIKPLVIGSVRTGKKRGKKIVTTTTTTMIDSLPISPIWLSSSAAATLSSSSEESDNLRNQTLRREERGETVSCWWMNFYTDMKERHPHLSCSGRNGLDLLDPYI